MWVELVVCVRGCVMRTPGLQARSHEKLRGTDLAGNLCTALQDVSRYLDSRAGQIPILEHPQFDDIGTALCWNNT